MEDLTLTLRPLGELPSGTAAAVGFYDGELSPRLQSLAARSLLADLIKDFAGITPLPRIVNDNCGKPRFADHPSLHFNLSHCDGAVLAAVARDPVGCDIERIATGAVDDSLMDFCLDEAQRAEVLAAADSDLEFTRIWTRKEALAKRSGRIYADVTSWPSDDTRVLTRELGRHVISIAW